MEQHPVPQNISSYEFRLVGDMTLKQFLQLAGGVLVGVILYRLPLIAILKYPLVFIAVITGAAMAFVPVNNRPFSQWLRAFFKAIYSPTKFVWVPTEVKTAAAPVPSATAPVTPKPVVLSFAQMAKSLFPSAPKVPPPPQSAYFASPTHAAPLTVSPPPPPQSPPTITTEAVISHFPAKPAPPETAPQAPVQTATVFTAPAQPEPAPAQTVTPVDPSRLPSASSQYVVRKSAATPAPPQASVASALTPPSIPNILSGIVTGLNQEPLPSVTVEIIDSVSRIPVRALRTNRLGQFQIAIPLPPGSYILQAEKESLGFLPVSVQIENKIVPPIIIPAQSLIA